MGEIMKLFLKVSLIIGLLTGFIHSLNLFSYHFLKNRILKRQKWDLNLCCGKTDGGGINADIVRHKSVPNLVIVDIYHLPFKANQFHSVLCSHTIEHVEQPLGLYIELNRVGRAVTLVTPPLWDVSAAFNVLEHKWIYWSLFTEHKHLPYYTPLPFSTSIQNLFGQRIKA
jgi:hypothetical protein